MSARPSDRYIPWYIVAFFAVQTVLFGWFMSIAHETYPGVVTEEAYDKGLAYNATIARVEEQEKLGWKGEFATGMTDDDANVTLTLRDATGNPLSGAHVALLFTRPVTSGMDVNTGMHETAPGVYTAKEKLAAKGLWEVRAEAKRGDKSFQVSQKVTFQ